MMMVLVTNSSHSYIIPVCLSTRYNKWLASIMDMDIWFASITIHHCIGVDKKVEKKVILAAFGQD